MTYFDERAKDWDSDPAKVERARVVAQAIRTELPLKAGMTALEFGCGTGLLSFALLQDFSSITLADTSQGMLDVLSGKIKDAGITNMQPLRLDLDNQPLPASRFDVTYSLMTMHHVPKTEIFLRHFHALLNPGGFLCIADLDKEDGSFHGPTVTDVHLGFDQPKLREIVEAAGFGNVHSAPVFAVKKIVDGREKDFPVFLMVAEKKT